jgi:hypothetical protein
MKQLRLRKPELSVSLVNIRWGYGNIHVTSNHFYLFLPRYSDFLSYFYRVICCKNTQIKRLSGRLQIVTNRRCPAAKLRLCISHILRVELLSLCQHRDKYFHILIGLPHDASAIHLPHGTREFELQRGIIL